MGAAYIYVAAGFMAVEAVANDVVNTDLLVAEVVPISQLIRPHGYGTKAQVLLGQNHEDHCCRRPRGHRHGVSGISRSLRPQAL